jgi:hypothetical protein
LKKYPTGFSNINKMSLERKGTMAGTATEGEKFLEKTGGTPKGKTRSESEEKEESHEAKEHKLERKGTMTDTAEAGEKFLEKTGGTPKSKTRSGQKKATKKKEQPTKKSVGNKGGRPTRSTRTLAQAQTEVQKLVNEISKKRSANESGGATKRRRLNEFERTAEEGAHFISHK